MLGSMLLQIFIAVTVLESVTWGMVNAQEDFGSM